ncbi:hypothetical protein [Corynebacterium lehmanniae]|uniref:S1 family peptidase n=1 Tax=Corynebacterium lehmanniae TaxID=2913497 RepID=A0ABT4RB49_9CORY|nr:hypothetical protein [Corynebacterium lehmanniae]MCZ9292779.1 S1 family peptidase [Corynebacterium lehmanniae]
MNRKIQTLRVLIPVVALTLSLTIGIGSSTALTSSESSSSPLRETPPPKGPAFEKIYRNSIGFSFLAAPWSLSPGVAIFNEDQGKSCSAGWFFERNGKILISTAGHCGKQGDHFLFINPEGDRKSIGRMTLSEYRSPADLGVSDFALIEIDDQSIIGSTVPLDNKYLPIELDYEDIPPASARGFDFICGLGFRSGLSCGPYDSEGERGELFFRRISDTGDSGGPVFGIRDSTIVPLALGSAGQNEDATKSLNQPILPKMQQYGLKLHL